MKISNGIEVTTEQVTGNDTYIRAELSFVPKLVSGSRVNGEAAIKSVTKQLSDLIEDVQVIVYDVVHDDDGLPREVILDRVIVNNGILGLSFYTSVPTARLEKFGHELNKELKRNGMPLR